MQFDPNANPRPPHRRRKEQEWYARPRHSTPEGRARAIAILEQNTAPSPTDDVPPK